MARLARTTPVTPKAAAPKAPKHEVHVSKLSQSLVNFTGRRSADVLLSTDTIVGMKNAAVDGWHGAAETSEARRAKMRAAARADLQKYLMQ